MSNMSKKENHLQINNNPSIRRRTLSEQNRQSIKNPFSKQVWQQERKAFLIILFLNAIQNIVGPIGLFKSITFALTETSVTYTDQGIMRLVSLPNVIKIFIAPLVDSYYIKKLGRIRTWLVPSMLIYSCLLIYLGFNYDDYINTLKTGEQPSNNVIVNSTVTDLENLNLIETSQLTSLRHSTVTKFVIIYTFITLGICISEISLDCLSFKLIKDEKNHSIIALASMYGNNLGVFLGYNIITLLRDPSFSKKWLGTEDGPFFSIANALLLFGVIVMLTVLATIFYSSNYSEKEEEQNHKNGVIDDEKEKFKLTETNQNLLRSQSAAESLRRTRSCYSTSSCNNAEFEANIDHGILMNLQDTQPINRDEILVEIKPENRHSLKTDQTLNKKEDYDLATTFKALKFFIFRWRFFYYCCFNLAFAVGFSSYGHTYIIKMAKIGFPKATFAGFSAFNIIIKLTLPIILSKYLINQPWLILRKLSVFYCVYGPFMAFIIYVTDNIGIPSYEYEEMVLKGERVQYSIGIDANALNFKNISAIYHFSNAPKNQFEHVEKIYPLWWCAVIFISLYIFQAMGSIYFTCFGCAIVQMSDPLIGGTALTLYRSVAVVKNAIFPTLVFYLVDRLSKFDCNFQKFSYLDDSAFEKLTKFSDINWNDSQKQELCVENQGTFVVLRDGFYILVLLGFLVGCLSNAIMWPIMGKMNSYPKESWHYREKGKEKKRVDNTNQI